MRKAVTLTVAVSMLAITVGALLAQDNANTERPQTRITADKAASQAADPRLERQKAPDTRQILQPQFPAGVGPQQITRTPVQQQQIRAMQEQMARKRSDFELYAAELKAIRKMALDEKAKKTAAYVDKILERKEAELAAQLKLDEQRIKQVQEQMEKAAAERARRLDRQREGAGIPERLQRETPKQNEKP